MNLLQTVKNNVPVSKEPYYWSTFILPSGEFVRIDQIDWESVNHNENNYFPTCEHEDLSVYLNTYCDTEIKWGDGTDFILDGAIKLNITYPYVILPKIKPTNAQLNALEIWLKQVPEEASFDSTFEADNLDMPLYIEILEKSQKFYDLAIYRPQDVVAAIEDSYKVGELVESTKLSIVEDFDREVYYDLEEQLIDSFYGLSESELMSYYSDTIETGGGAIWILPNGKTIELDLHSDFGSEIFYKFCKAYFKNHPEYSEDYSEDDFALEDCNDFNDHLSYALGWAKLNTGTFYDDRYYLVPPRQRMTNNQFRTLEAILEETSDNADSLLVLPWVTTSVTYYFSKHTPKSIVKSLQKFYTSGILEESTERYNGMIFTDSPYTIRDYCVNRPDAYRILYDANIDLYMLCDASLHIHWDLINQAYDLGFYSELKADETLDEVVRDYITDRDLFNYTDIGCDGFYDNGDDCIEIGQYLMYAIWVPNGMNEDEIDNSPSSDGYDDEFEFPAGSLFTRGLDTDLMNKVDLINILRRSQPAKLTEGVSKSFLTKLTTAWSKDTCHPAYTDKWSEANPAIGQCLVTALVIQDELGGDIYDCKVGRSRHFYNVVNGETIDLTFSQFPEGSKITDSRIRDRKQLLANKETRHRYELLKNKIGEIKQMTEAFNSKQNTVELEYIDLPITIQSSMDRNGQWNEREVLKDFTLVVDKEAIITKIFEDYISDEDILGGLKGFSDEAIEQFIRNNFETLFTKYYDNLLDFYKDDAIEACEEDYGWDDYEADEHDDYADFLYDQWRDDQYESAVTITAKDTLTENWDNNDTEFIDYVLNQFNEFLKTWPTKPYNRDSDFADVDTLISRFLTKGLTEEKIRQIINDMEYYLDYSGVELDDDVDLNKGSIWDWTDKYTHYLIVEQNFAEVLDTVGYEKAKELVQAWKQSNEIKSNIKTENLINREEPPYYNFNEFWFFVAKYWLDCDAERSALNDAFDYGMSHPEAAFNDCPVFYDRYNHEGEYLELAFEAGQESADFII